MDACVTAYMKGYKGRRDDVFEAPIERDYQLSRPTKIEVLGDTEPGPGHSAASDQTQEGDKRRAQGEARPRPNSRGRAKGDLRARTGKIRASHDEKR